MENEGFKVKILGVNGSARHANTETAVQIALKAAEDTGYAQTDYLCLGDYDLRPCTGCMKCFGWQAPDDGKVYCREFNDGFGEILERVMASDAMLFGAPVYVMGVNALSRVFMEKMHMAGYFSVTPYYGRLTHRPVGLITVAGQSGHEQILPHMYDWAIGLGMMPMTAPPRPPDTLPVTSVNGGPVVAVDAKSIYAKNAITKAGTRTIPPTQGSRNERTLRNLAKNVVEMALIVKAGKEELAKKGIKLPEIFSFKKYSVKPKRGSFVEKLMKEGKLQYVSTK
ncbi:MAG: flavodoxin family protein [Desulfobacterales bacterium]|nr:flavodoxin family protein [Desulfobacterales bacterium]